MASFSGGSAPTRRAVSVQLLLGQQFTPTVVVELQLPLLFNNVISIIRESLKQSLPSLRSKLNSISSPKHNRKSVRLFVLRETTAL